MTDQIRAGQRAAFASVTTLFFAWGFITVTVDPLIATLKAIYELLESISDRCEDVANLIEGVVLENS